MPRIPTSSTSTRWSSATGRATSSSTPRRSRTKLKSPQQAACRPSTWSRSSSSTWSRIPTGCNRSRPGKTYVYPDFQRDKYGTFLSGHAPIYDSQGRYSGFVGVDFDLQYYLAQEASFRAISIGTLTGAVLLALLIGYVAARYHFDLNDRIEQQYRASIRDELTKLLNRRGALTAVSEALAVSASTYATILVDVDDLKSINDNYGHVTGDELLVSVAEAIRESVRASDICARFGGDEFLIFAAGCDLDAATEIARRILEVHGSRRSRVAAYRSASTSRR